MVSTPTKAGATGFVGTVTTEATVGLSRAGEAAGGVLNSIFGGLPWDLSPGGIVDAVAGGGGDAAAGAAGMVAPTVIHVAGVLL
jgi:hypothetical protein